MFRAFEPCCLETPGAGAWFPTLCGLLEPVPLAAISGASLPHFQLSSSLKSMEVHFTIEQEAQLVQIAAKAGTDPERLVKDAALRLFGDERGFRVPAPELPVWRLGAIGPFHRSDLYDDAL